MNINALDGGGDIADNGGPTETIALADDSPAVDRIPLDLNGVAFAPPLFDQAGNDRPFGDGFDVGALELDPVRVRILTPPADTNVVVGSNATFSVTVGGQPPFAYQWFFNGTALSGQTGSSILITNAQTNSQGNFQVVITNDFNSVTSRLAVLTVHEATNSPPVTNSIPLITQQPSDQSVLVGSSATFAVSATSQLPLFYQWVFRTDPNSSFANVPNATNALLTITNVQLSNSGQFRVGISNSVGATNSLIVTLSVTDTNFPGGP